MKEDFIFSQQSKNIKTSNEDSFFCRLKHKDFIDKDNNPRLNNEEDIKILAKIKYKSNGIPKYLIRIDETKKLFNPTLDLPEVRSIKALHSIGGSGLSFKEVNKKAFDHYLMFLKTDNPSWILNAEREDL